jgi:hypothetical protein
MSDLAAAAAALGLPEVLVQRSAEARASETGASVDEIIAAWAGGAPPPEASSPVEQPPTEPTATVAPADDPPKPEVTTELPEEPAVVSVAEAGPYKPPVLVGSRDNPMTVVFGAVALFVLVALIGLVGPSLQAETPGALSSDLPYSQTAVDGQDLYRNLGCAACHTQMVRPVIADVGLGAVTLNDSNQILGTRRFGPDLSNVGSRATATEVQATIEGQLSGHPAYNLEPQDMSALVAYLSESATDRNG